MFQRIAPKLVAELVGTFAFVLIGAGAAAIVGDGVGLPGITAIALAHGLAITAFAFAYGPVSGGHMNPAVTIGVLAAGSMRVAEATGYVVSQLIGGVVAAFLLAALLDGPATGLGTPFPYSQAHVHGNAESEPYRDQGRLDPSKNRPCQQQRKVHPDTPRRRARLPANHSFPRVKRATL